MTPPRPGKQLSVFSYFDAKPDPNEGKWIENFVTLLFWIPALSVAVFLRHSLGYRMIKPLYFLPAFAVMTAAGIAGATVTATFGAALGSRAQSSGFQIPALVLFAVPMLGLAIYHRRQAWQLIFSHQWHTMSAGLPHLLRVLPHLPRTFQFTESIIRRRVEPLLVALFGVLVLYFFSSIAFGLWLVFAGLTLGLAEEMIYERAINDLLDRHDARVETRYAIENDALVKSGGRRPETSAETGGFMVTVAPELEDLLRPTDEEVRQESEATIRRSGLTSEERARYEDLQMQHEAITAEIAKRKAEGRWDGEP